MTLSKRMKLGIVSGLVAVGVVMNIPTDGDAPPPAVRD